ncbi:MAG TPA: circularly permuted type 2 ATP-grasp protein [Candidatus Acidoferrales bacterium]|nr:circularly permuted type 2 ATP-grasp protein [Candidatus Acidoferrales bacterium]
MSEPTTADSLRGQTLRLHADYRLAPDRFDEMCMGSGELRSHWEYLVRALEGLGPEDFHNRCEETRRLLNESGVTYNVYSEQTSTDRLWPLDPLPLLMTSAEWGNIEQAISQRAELLSLILGDLYGPQLLLRRGLLPPEVVWSHPGFLRPCADMPSARAQRLPLYAADLARTPDGSLRVIGDRSQAPSGAGYAIENRLILSRVFPSVYRDSSVHRLALFFRAFRSLLSRLGPNGQDNPRIVVLTPGPENETYFEHAYLAAYLGYPLVQGSDLIVHDDRVWLRALDAQKPVDVILRRVDDEYCDPLELRGDSLLGTPGLLHVVRAGNVVLANPLGSGVLENPGLMAFLPALARELLGEDLHLASVPTWWCGQAEGLTYVLEHLEQLVVKPIVPHASAVTVFGGLLSTQERWQLAERIRARPHLYVGQHHLALSTAPAVVNGGIEPRPLVLRSFAVADEGGYFVMPGGLCRVAPRPDVEVVSNQLGGVSKDVWVLASEPERQLTLITATAPLANVASEGDDVPSRVADDLYWLGRYAERTDGTARLLREVLGRLLESERLPHDEAVPLLLQAVTAQTATYPGFVGEGAEERLQAPDAELLSVLHDRRRVGSLRYDVDAVVRVGRSVRDRLSSDASRAIYALSRELGRSADLASSHDTLQRVIFQMAGFAGLCSDSMSRGQGWRFLQIGRSLERAMQSLSLLQSILLPAAEKRNVPALEALLAVAHSIKTYRRRYRGQIQLACVVDLLLADETNPRSVGYELAALEELVASLDGPGSVRRSPAARLALDLLTQVRLFDLDDVVELGAEPLVPLLGQLIGGLAALSDELTRRYFAHAEPPQQLVRIV